MARPRKPKTEQPRESYSTVDYVREWSDDDNDETVAAMSTAKRVRLDLPADISYVASHPAFLKVINSDYSSTIPKLSKKDLSGDLAPPSQEAVTLLSWARRNPDKFMDKLMAMQVNSQRRISDKNSGGADVADAVDDDLSNVEEALRAKLARC